MGNIPLAGRKVNDICRPREYPQSSDAFSVPEPSKKTATADYEDDYENDHDLNAKTLAWQQTGLP